MKNSDHRLTVTGILKRAVLEYQYFTCKGWSLTEVGDFWDSVSDYDDINEATYSYYRRFTNSYDLAKHFIKSGSIMLDIQTRSGKGSEFWQQKGSIQKSYLVDFSDYLLSIAKHRFKNSNYRVELIKVSDYDLPFDDLFFDLVATYETIEHIGNVDVFMRELSRVLKPGGLMILTCPNILWEPVHWFSAIFNIHHSEGPHNFLRRKKLLRLFQSNHLKILKENTTVILPFNQDRLIYFNERLEKTLPEKWIRFIGLRRSFVLRKISISD